MPTRSPPPEHAISTPMGVAWFDDDTRLLHHRLDAGVHVTEKVAKETFRVLGSLADGHSLAAVVDMRGLAFADRDARTEFSAPPVDGEVATAMIVAPGVSELIAHLFVEHVHPERPIALFESDTEAVSWASSQLSASS